MPAFQDTHKQTDRQRSDSIGWTVFGRLFVKRFALCYQTVVCLSACLSCLSVCPVCDVGVLCPNGWIDQDETWHAGMPRPWSHCVRWGPCPFLKRGTPPIFDPYLMWANGWMDQDATWSGGRPRLRRHCVRWGPPPPKGARPPIFGPCPLWSNGRPS